MELWGSVRREIYGGKEVGKKCREGKLGSVRRKVV